jgi:hypothetical protein
MGTVLGFGAKRSQSRMRGEARMTARVLRVDWPRRRSLDRRRRKWQRSALGGASAGWPTWR